MKPTPLPRVVAALVLGLLFGGLMVMAAAPALAADPPTLTGISPSSGPSAGGTPVTLTGTGFQAGATLTFNGVSATDIVVVSATQVTAVTPPGPQGPATVIVTNPDGQGASLGGAFIYLGPVPTIAGVSPDHGPSTGGTAVTVSGTDFRSGASVRFGGALATNVSVVSGTTITATTPAHATGLVAVTVTNSDGQSATAADAYTYDPAPPPVVSGVSPSSGSTGGGTPVTVSGSGFQPGAAVRFAGALATNISVVSATSITAVTPVGAAGAVTVQVTNPDGQAGALVQAYTYVATPAPVVTGVSPNTGPLVGGNTVVVSGTGFLPGAAVLFGASSGTSVTVLGATQLSVVVPASAVGGTVSVRVTNTDGKGFTLANAYTYSGPPTITSVSPSNGTTGGGTPVTITGTNFASGATVRFGTSLATSVNVLNGGAISATTPAHSSGTVSITVTNPNGQSAQLSSAFTYISAPAPVVQAVSPNAGPVSGGNVVTVLGSNFLPGASVTFGTRSGTGVSVLDGTHLTVIVPAASSTGSVSVRVTNTDGKSDSKSSAYTYTPPPTIVSVSPGSGTTAGGTSVTITGTNFSSGMTVLFGGFAATDVTFVTSTQIVAKTPPRSAGTVPVVVQTPGGAQATLLNAFTYRLPATLFAIAPITGPTGGGTLVTITGSNFASGLTVRIGGASATSVVVVSGSQVTARTPAHAAGPAAVEVRSADGILATGSLTFTYTVSPGAFDRPVNITGINPVIWNGGTTAQFEAAVVAVGAKSATVFVAGKPLVFIPTAPAFVNQAFRSAFPTSLPDGTIVLVVR